MPDEQQEGQETTGASEQTAASTEAGTDTGSGEQAAS